MSVTKETEPVCRFRRQYWWRHRKINNEATKIITFCRFLKLVSIVAQLARISVSYGLLCEEKDYWRWSGWNSWPSRKHFWFQHCIRFNVNKCLIKVYQWTLFLSFKNLIYLLNKSLGKISSLIPFKLFNLICKERDESSVTYWGCELSKLLIHSSIVFCSSRRLYIYLQTE